MGISREEFLKNVKTWKEGDKWVSTYDKPKDSAEGRSSIESAVNLFSKLNEKKWYHFWK